MICSLVEWAVNVSYCVTVNSSFYACQCLSYELRCSYVGCIGIYNSFVFFLDGSLDHYIVSFLIYCNVLNFNVCFVWYEDCYPSFLLLPICMEYIFPSSHFQSICVFRSEVGSCRERLYGSYFCIHSASLCLLVGVFNPFTFKTIIDICVCYWHFLDRKSTRLNSSHWW